MNTETILEAKISCENCTRVKKRCGENFPCDACVRKGIVCQKYFKRKPGRNPKNFSPDDDESKTKRIAMVADTIAGRGFLHRRQKTTRYSSISTFYDASLYSRKFSSSFRQCRSVPSTSRGFTGIINIQCNQFSPTLSDLIQNERADLPNDNYAPVGVNDSGQDCNNHHIRGLPRLIDALDVFNDKMIVGQEEQCVFDDFDRIKIEEVLFVIKELVSSDHTAIQIVITEMDIDFALLHAKVANQIVPVLSCTILYNVVRLLNGTESVSNNSDSFGSLILLLCGCGLGAAYSLSSRSLQLAELCLQLMRFVTEDSDISLRSLFAIEIFFQHCAVHVDENSKLSEIYTNGMFSKIASNLLANTRYVSLTTKSLIHLLHASTQLDSNELRFDGMFNFEDLEASCHSTSYYTLKVMHEWFNLMFTEEIDEIIYARIVSIDHSKALTVDCLVLASLGSNTSDPMIFALILFSTVLRRIFRKDSQPYTALQDLSKLGEFLCQHKEVLYISASWHWCHMILRMIFQSKLPNYMSQVLLIGRQLIYQMPRLQRYNIYEDPVIYRSLSHSDKNDVNFTHVAKYSTREVSNLIADSNEGDNSVRPVCAQDSSQTVLCKPVIPKLPLEVVNQSNEASSLPSISNVESEESRPYASSNRTYETILSRITSERAKSFDEMTFRGSYDRNSLLNQYFQPNLSKSSFGVKTDEREGNAVSFRCQDIRTTTSQSSDIKLPMKSLSQELLLQSYFARKHYDSTVSFEIPEYMMISSDRIFDHISFTSTIRVDDMSLEHVVAFLDLNRPFPWENIQKKLSYTRDSSYDHYILCDQDLEALFSH